MPSRGSHQQPPSPLDAFLVRFLAGVDRLPDGFSPVSDGVRLAEECDVVPAFVDALFVSARTRGLIEPFRSKGAKGRYRWKVSRRGERWRATLAEASGTGREEASVAAERAEG